LRCWVWSSIRLPREPKNSCLSLAPRADSRFQKQQIHNSQLFVIIPAAAVAYSLSYLQIIRKPRGDKQTRLGPSERKKLNPCGAIDFVSRLRKKSECVQPATVPLSLFFASCRSAATPNPMSRPRVQPHVTTCRFSEVKMHSGYTGQNKCADFRTLDND
jgi:hypothetical protein